MLKLYNTLSKNIEPIEKKDHINLYTCGPTVYNYAHIGNLRSYILADLLYRTLKYDGYKPHWVMNITDIDDKTIKGTIAKYGDKATVENLREFTKFFLDEFLKDLTEVNVLKDEITFIRVTDVIPQIQDFIIALMDKGYAYQAEDGSVYFSIEKYQKDFGDYGHLVGEKFLEGKKVGARVKVDEYEKDNLSDFALWKAHDIASDANIFWDHPKLGKGRPGWHIECSVINQIAFNGETTDIHTGGVDLMFPHHTNEIAQSQALLGKGNFVRHWFHSEHLLVDGKKMSKSANNFYTLKDLAKQNLTGADLRSLFCSAHYRVQQNFTDSSIKSSQEGLERMFGLFRNANHIGVAKDSFQERLKTSISEDLAASQTLAILQDYLSMGQISRENIRGCDQLFGLEISSKEYSVSPSAPPDLNISVAENVIVSDELEVKLVERAESRNNKDFKASDRLRLEIEAMGYEVMDTPDGQKVKKKLQI